MRALVVGYGSIGARHARLLEGLEVATAVVSNRAESHPRTYPALEPALHDHRPDYVVIANTTAQHLNTLTALARSGFSGTVLVEKPLFSMPAPIPKHRFERAYVGYNLRFHPLLIALGAALGSDKPIAINAYVGQYLPDWRPGTDYRNGYSAKTAEGGGALRDLSHELDYIHVLAGPWVTATARGGHFSPLEIDSDDVFALLLQTDRCPLVCVQMSYLDRVPRRQVVINTEDQTLSADFIHGTLTINGNVRHYDCGRDDTYLAMHRAVISSDDSRLCSLETACLTQSLIAAAEQSMRSRIWITR